VVSFAVTLVVALASMFRASYVRCTLLSFNNSRDGSFTVFLRTGSSVLNKALAGQPMPADHDDCGVRPNEVFHVLSQSRPVFHDKFLSVLVAGVLVVFLAVTAYLSTRVLFSSLGRAQAEDCLRFRLPWPLSSRFVLAETVRLLLQFPIGGLLYPLLVLDSGGDCLSDFGDKDRTSGGYSGSHSDLDGELAGWRISAIVFLSFVLFCAIMSLLRGRHVAFKLLYYFSVFGILCLLVFFTSLHLKVRGRRWREEQGGGRGKGT
jgi:hypothetical protein